MILVPSQNYTKILLYTFFPYSEEHCEEVTPILHNSFQNNSFELSSPHFPQKFGNFHQCPLVMAAYPISPYIILSGSENGTNYPGGIAGIIYMELSKKLNFTSIVQKKSDVSRSVEAVIVYFFYFGIYKILCAV